MPKYSWRAQQAAFLAGVLLWACSGSSDKSNGPVPVASVTITSTDSVRSPMEASQFQADIQDTSGSLMLRAVTWSVSDTLVATISTLGLLTAGDGYCWGDDHAHHLGVADGTGFISPSLVLNGYLFREIDVGLEHTCGVTTTGEGVCWGKNAHGEVGDSSHIPRLATLVHGGFSWLTIHSDGYTSCGIVQGGQAYCWGDNNTGYLGVDSTFQFDVVEPRPVQNSGTYTSIVMGEFSECALAVSGQVFCWGYNTLGELGTGVMDSVVYKTPQPVSGGHLFSAISAGPSAVCGIVADSTAWCWGRGEGLGTPGPLAQPTLVPGGHRFVAIASGTDRSCGLTAGGGLWCWGRSPLGEGVVHPSQVTTPVRVRDP